MGRFYSDPQGVMFVDSNEHVLKNRRAHVGMRVVEVRRRRVVGIYNPARQGAESWSRQEFIDLANATLAALRQNAFGEMVFADHNVGIAGDGI